MKQIIFPLILLLLAACRHDDTLPEATSAAKEVYLQYADRKDLTVAFIGDYQGYNAVMLQAQTTEDWLRLCEEFGVRKHVDADALDTTRVSSLTIASVNTGDYNNIEETMSHLSNSSIREIVTHIYDSLIGLEPAPYSQPYSIRIDTAYAITKRMHYDHGVLVESGKWKVENNQGAEANFQLSTFNSQLLKTTIGKGHTGYIIRDDSDALTLWLFFYSNDSEKTQILNTIQQ